MLTDFHCHLQSEFFRDDLPEVIFRAKKHGIGRFICNSVDIPDWLLMVKTAPRFKGVIIPCSGVHPLYVDEKHPAMLPKILPYILSRLDKEHEIKTPIGEIGLDRYVDNRDDSLQETVFRIQLKFAREENRVVMLHTRKALDRVIEILQEEGPFPAILFHGFSGPMERVPKMIDLGGFFSFSANLLKPNYKKTHDAALQVPLDRILLESDAPDMPPPEEMVPDNWPEPTENSIHWNAAISTQQLHKLAEIRKISVNELLEQLLADGSEAEPEDWPKSVPIRNEPAIIGKILTKLAEIRKMPENDLIKQIQVNEQQFMKHISN